MERKSKVALKKLNFDDKSYPGHHISGKSAPSPPPWTSSEDRPLHSNSLLISNHVLVA